MEMGRRLRLSGSIAVKVLIFVWCDHRLASAPWRRCFGVSSEEGSSVPMIVNSNEGTQCKDWCARETSNAWVAGRLGPYKKMA